MAVVLDILAFGAAALPICALFFIVLFMSAPLRPGWPLPRRAREAGEELNNLTIQRRRPLAKGAPGYEAPL